jgi:hypothetical protein
MDWYKHLPSLLAWGGSIVTGLFTLLGVWLANRSSLEQLTVRLAHEAEREHKEAIRSRLEELYSSIDGWSGSLVVHHITYRKVMEGDLTYNQALDITIKSGQSLDAKRIFTLADLYFPTAHKALQELKELRDQAAAIQSSFKEEHRKGMLTSEKHAMAITEVLDRFNKAVTNYKAALAAYAQDV